MIWVIKINCDLCGKVDEKLYRTMVERVELNVCSGCSRFGRILAPIEKDFSKKQLQKIGKSEEKEEKIQLLIEDYPHIIKKGRESMGLTQKDFANKIDEKESIIHKIETGTLEPSLYLVKKLEKVLGIKLIEEHQERHEAFKRKKEGGFTLGDFIKVKK